MHTKSITVFGGTGFIGRYIVARLARTGALIRIATREPGKALFLKTNGQVGQIVPIRCDIHDDASVAAAVQGSDIVINLIGILYERGRNTFNAIHVETARRIARAAKNAGATRLIHMSALGASIVSTSRYAKSKAEGEAAVRQEFPGATILRPSIVFGPEDQFFNTFACLSRFTPVLPLIGGGKTKFQPVYVGDIDNAVQRVLEKSDTAGKIYELGGPAIYTFRELMELMMQETMRPRLLIDVPFGIAKLKAFFLQFLPRPLLTPDQVELLKTDNVVGMGALTFRDLGIVPTCAEVILPTYLERFRPGGRFASAT